MSEHVFSVPKETVLGEPLVAGNYRVTVVSAVETKSKAGNEMIELNVRVDEPARFAGRNLRDYLVFGPKTGWKIDQVLAAIGAAGEDGKMMNVVPDLFMGESGVVRVEMEPDQVDRNKEWPRIKTWLWGERAEEADLGPFDKWAPEPKRAPDSKTVPAVTNTSNADDVADDDIPF